MTQHRKRALILGSVGVLISIVVVGALLVNSGALAGKPRFSNAPAYTALAQAEATWANNPVDAYSLEVTIMPSLGTDTCNYIVVVEHEEIIETPTNDCNLDTHTVSGLLQELRRELTQFDGTCGPNGCSCDGPIGLEAVYDPEHGYPHQASFRMMSEFAYQYRNPLEYMIGNTNCTLVGLVFPELLDVQLTPLTN